MQRTSLTVRFVFAICLLAATFNHAKAIAQHGLFFDYGYGHDITIASKLYWDILVILDPLAALLLFIKPRAGILLTAAIIISDVAHNTYYVVAYDHWYAVFYLSQVAFLIAVLGLAPLALKPFPREQR